MAIVVCMSAPAPHWRSRLHCNVFYRQLQRPASGAQVLSQVSKMEEIGFYKRNNTRIGACVGCSWSWVWRQSHCDRYRFLVFCNFLMPLIRTEISLKAGVTVGSLILRLWMGIGPVDSHGVYYRIHLVGGIAINARWTCEAFIFAFRT
jgi:hypothetical protein